MYPGLEQLECLSKRRQNFWKWIWALSCFLQREILASQNKNKQDVRGWEDRITLSKCVENTPKTQGKLSALYVQAWGLWNKYPLQTLPLTESI